MLSLLSATLGFASLPDPTCICGNHPLYASANEAGEMSHEMCIFGTTWHMPMDATMPMGGDPDYACPDNGVMDQSPSDVSTCASYMDASCP